MKTMTKFRMMVSVAALAAGLGMVPGAAHAYDSIVCGTRAGFAGDGTAAYQPGVDVNGNAVAPADVTPPAPGMGNVVRVPMSINLAQRLSQMLPPGTEMKADAGVVEIYRDGRVMYNGMDITTQTNVLCREKPVVEKAAPKKKVKKPEPKPVAEDVIEQPAEEPAPEAAVESAPVVEETPAPASAAEMTAPETMPESTPDVAPPAAEPVAEPAPVMEQPVPPADAPPVAEDGSVTILAPETAPAPAPAPAPVPMETAPSPAPAPAPVPAMPETAPVPADGAEVAPAPEPAPAPAPTMGIPTPRGPQDDTTIQGGGL